MRTRLKLKPGDRGTRKLQQKYGDRLVCVRYRYDVPGRKRYKTVELVVDEIPWEPSGAPIIPDQVVALRVGAHEKDVQQRIKQAGGRWDVGDRVWRLQHKYAVELGYEDRIVTESGLRAYREAGF